MNHARACLALLILSLVAALVSADAPRAADPPLAGEKMLRGVLAEARVRPVRIFYGGTSIQCTPYGGLRWLENLRHTYGDSGNSTIPVRVLGGSLAPYSGWKKQSGGLMVRLRGDAESKDLVFPNTFGKTLIIHYAVEADGGTCDVYVDDQKAGTIECGGAQAYNRQFVLDFPDAKYRRLTLKPPASGHVYIEAVTQRLDKPGIDFIDGAMGATAVEHLLTLPGAVEQWNIPASIQPAKLYDAFDAYMLDTSAEGKCDIVYFGWAVNDAYSVQNVDARYAPAVAHLVERTKANGQCLILVVEPGGHLSVPGEPERREYAAYARIREVLRSHAKQPHVVLIDHYDLLETPKPDASLPEWQAWASRNYLATVSAVKPKLEMQGDFIHPLSQAYECQVAALNAVSGSRDYVPAEFTWVGVPPGADAKAWPEEQQWHQKANWSDRIAPAKHPGATVTIERWPADGSGAYGGTHGITLAYSQATIGRLHLGGDGGTIAFGNHPTAGTGRLVFDNRGQPAEIKGVGEGTATIRAAVHSDAALRLDVGMMKSIAVMDYAGPGDLLVVGRTDGGVNNTSLGLGPASGCRKSSIDPGARVTISGSSVPPTHQDIIVNGTLELATAGATSVAMQSGQTISGTGTVRAVATNPAQARVKTVAGARIVAGAGSPGPLTFADTRLCLGGGTVECAVGEKGNATIATSHVTQPSLAIGGEPNSAKTTVKIIDAGRTSTGTVPLFSYTGALSGDIATLSLELPPRWRAMLADNPGNSTIDLRINAIEP